jgi:hypothetical protein
MRPPEGLALAGGGGVNTRQLVTSAALLVASVALGGAIAGARMRLPRGVSAPLLGGGSPA